MKFFAELCYKQEGSIIEISDWHHEKHPPKASSVRRKAIPHKQTEEEELRSARQEEASHEFKKIMTSGERLENTVDARKPEGYQNSCGALGTLSKFQSQNRKPTPLLIVPAMSPADSEEMTSCTISCCPSRPSANKSTEYLTCTNDVWQMMLPTSGFTGQLCYYCASGVCRMTASEPPGCRQGIFGGLPLHTVRSFSLALFGQGF